MYIYILIIPKKRFHSSYEIEDIVETHLCKLCVIPYSYRAYYGLCVLMMDVGRWQPMPLQCSYQGQEGNVSQSVRGNYKPVFEGDKILPL